MDSLLPEPSFIAAPILTDLLPGALHVLRLEDGTETDLFRPLKFQDPNKYFDEELRYRRCKKDLDQIFPKPATLTSEVLEQVKALPETKQTFLIYQEEEYPLPPSSDLKKASVEVQKRLRNGVKFRIFKVDEGSVEYVDRLLNDYNRGALKVDEDELGAKVTKAFSLVQTVVCHRGESHQKNLLSSFVKACMEPYNLLPPLTESHTPKRPTKVLFESPEDANHPTVRMFLSMMGCSCVETVDSTCLAWLLHRKEDVIQSSKVFSKSSSPYLHDIQRGVECGHCEVVAVSSLTKCTCKKVYYCSDECQQADWENHKKDHKAALKKAKQN